jgi:hypothetical protein
MVMFICCLIASFFELAGTRAREARAARRGNEALSAMIGFIR